MRCSSRIVLTLATAFTAMTAVAAPRLQAAEPTTGAVPRSAPASLAELKAQYRRPETIPFPKDNPYTVEKATLGKKLYFDTRLSAANLLSCAACHSPAYGWGDGQPRGIGHNMKQLGRRSPTIVNAAFGEIFMWDGRAGSLEEQALGPIRADVEMNLPIDQLLAKLKAIPEYQPLFKAAFPKDGMTPDNIAKAIATYERTVVSGRAPFDAWIEGDERAIPEEAKRGFVLFNNKGGCQNCHSGWNFTDDSFHDIGLSDADVGRGKFLPAIVKMQQAFKTPGLREITRRGPYMHDGSVATLEAVIEHYNTAGVERPSRSELIKPLALSAQEKADLVAFMKTLTSNMDPTTVPVLPR
ncbi:MAG TPA: cytochrome c peroxidase [Xanthobacteraceae bacterium]|nr:cytochrome c peroxidase [Xanthobacteraceae bacterium]